jgi:plasmid maintenance system antidote protein VapI
LSANKLAAALHVPANRISAIINGTRGIAGRAADNLHDLCEA